MTEAEVSIRLALYYIKNRLTEQDVEISLDGMHAKCFDIRKFMSENMCSKAEKTDGHWKGRYCVAGFQSNIIIGGKLKQGDVRIKLRDGRLIYAECKRGNRKGESPGVLRPLMHEAIGQLMTGCVMDDRVIPAVVVPYMKKTLEYTEKWRRLDAIQKMGIHFMLVHESGKVDEY